MWVRYWQQQSQYEVFYPTIFKTCNWENAFLQWLVSNCAPLGNNEGNRFYIVTKYPSFVFNLLYNGVNTWEIGDWKGFICYKKKLLYFFPCKFWSIYKSIDYITFSPMHNSIIELFLIRISCVHTFMSKSFNTKIWTKFYCWLFP